MGAPRTSINSSAVYHSPGSTSTRISCRMFMENALCRLLLLNDLVVLVERFEGLMTKMAVWKNGPESRD